MKNLNQQQRLIRYLERFGKINPIKAWTQLGIYRLADGIFKLRKKGYKIETLDKNVKNRFNENCVVAEYRLKGML
jgi:Helix-turn-helix domain